jgi:cation diffusion facilitator CzcD-associated flavoprotein CzcO
MDGKQEDPVVVVIGAGHSGLEQAARLKSLNVPTLVIEKHGRVGDSWRTRAKTLSLHNPVRKYYFRLFPFNVLAYSRFRQDFNHMAYIPYVLIMHGTSSFNTKDL